MGSKPAVSKASITALFQSDDAAALGIDDRASDILIAGLNGNNLPQCIGAPVDKLDTDDVVIIKFLFDASPSMEEAADQLIAIFNDTMIQGLRGASRQTASTILVGALAFSTKIKPIWGGEFLKLADVPKLTRREYDPRRGDSTNLYEAQHDGILSAAAYGTEVLQGTGTPPKIFVVGLTDGADNCGRIPPADIKTLVTSMSKELWKFPLAVFKTYEADRVDGRQIARDTGFDVFESEPQPGETPEDVQRRFRHTLGTMSSSLVAASRTKIGAASKTSFWTPGV